MTPEQQRIAIAEACGFELEPASVEFGHPCFDNWVKGDDSYMCPPDYLNDLNAMHEAEGILDGMSIDARSMYSDYLALMHSELFEKSNNGMKRDPFDREWMVFRSTPTQRAEALLRTIGKWKSI